MRSAIVVFKTSLNDLVARGDAGSPGDHTNLCLAGDWLLCDIKIAMSFVEQSPFRSFHQHVFSDVHFVNILAHNSAVRESWVHVCKVNLQKDVHVPSLGDHADRRVLPFYHLSVNLSAENNMLADREPKSMHLILESESVNMSVL